MRLAFGTLPDRVSAGTTSETVVSITDDDVPSVAVSFEQGTYTVAEGGTVGVTVTLDQDPERTVTIPMTKVNQGTASDADYSGVPANVVFNSGETEKSITFSATQDTIDDDDESVLLGFGATLPARVSAGTPNQTTVSITDDDHPEIDLSFEASAYSAAEGGAVDVTVTLSADPERTVLIPITKVNQGTASDADYSGVPANVVFNSGETEKSITFSATQDTIDDDGESVRLAFGTLPDRVSAGTTSETVVSITDDDVPSVAVSFEQGTYTVAEGGTVGVTVTLDQDPERTVTIPMTKVNQGTASDADYSGVPANVVFNSGETEKSITFSAATQDDEDDDGESVRLDLRNAARPGISGFHQRDRRLDHRRRRAVRGGELRAGDVHGGRGRHGGSHGDPGPGPGTHGHHPHDQGQPGHYLPRRLFRRARQRHLQQRETRRRASPSPPRRTR